MCQSVRFSYTGSPRFVADCVCDSCRKAHGATAVTWVGVENGQFTIMAGEASVEWYASSSESERGFCKTCGTRMFFRSEKWTGEIHMALACIDTPHDLVATRVSFAEEFPNWTSLRLHED